MYSEFFRGSLDLIYYNPHSAAQSLQRTKLDKIIESKYPQYQVQKTARSIIKFAEIKQVKDSALLHNILNELNNTETAQLTLPKDSTMSLVQNNLVDSVRQEIKWYSTIQDTSVCLLDSKYLTFTRSNVENINPTDPHIVIREMVADFVDQNGEETASEWLNKKLQNEENSSFLILDVHPEYVIYNNNLKGIEQRNSLSSMAKNAYYENAKTY